MGDNFYEQRPKTRGDCKGGPRPCPWVACKHHLYLDVMRATLKNPCGGIKINHPGKEVDELEETCVLDVSDRGGATLEEVGRLMKLTRERIRQIETKARRKMQLRKTLRLYWEPA